MSRKATFTDTTARSALRVLRDNRVVMASQFGRLLESVGAMQFKHERISAQGYGVAAARVAYYLRRRGWCTYGGHGDRYLVTKEGLRFLETGE